MIKLNEIINGLNPDSTPDEIFLYIKSLPIKYKIGNIKPWGIKIGTDGFDSALKNSSICYFYLMYLHNHKKKSIILNIPQIKNKELYNKLQPILLWTNKHLSGYDTENKSWYSNDEKTERRFSFTKLEMSLFQRICLHIWNWMIFKEYFGDMIHLKYDIFQLVSNYNIDPNNYKKLYDEWTEKNGDTNVTLFFANVDTITHTITHYQYR